LADILYTYTADKCPYNVVAVSVISLINDFLSFNWAHYSITTNSIGYTTTDRKPKTMMVCSQIGAECRLIEQKVWCFDANEPSYGAVVGKNWLAVFRWRLCSTNAVVSFLLATYGI
jgi:hypothetical protein